MSNADSVNMEPTKDVSQIPSEEIQDLLLLKDDPLNLDKKIWESVDKYKVSYVKLLVHLQNLNQPVAAKVHEPQPVREPATVAVAQPIAQPVHYDLTKIPLEEIQELLLIKEEPVKFEEKLWEVVNKHKIPYVKILAYFQELTHDYSADKKEIEKEEVAINGMG